MISLLFAYYKNCIQDHCLALEELNALLESHFKVISKLWIV